MLACRAVRSVCMTGLRAPAHGAQMCCLDVLVCADLFRPIAPASCPSRARMTSLVPATNTIAATVWSLSKGPPAPSYCWVSAVVKEVFDNAYPMKHGLTDSILEALATLPAAFVNELAMTDGTMVEDALAKHGVKQYFGLIQEYVCGPGLQFPDKSCRAR